MKRYEFSRADGVCTTTVHFSDNATFLQTGANEKENFNILFADMSASVLL